MNVGGKTEACFIFISIMSAMHSSFWLIAANSAVGLFPVCGFASQPTLCALSPTPSLVTSQRSIYWKLVTGQCCFTLCLSVFLLVFLGSPISGSLISSSKNNLVQQNRGPPGFINPLG